MNEMTKALNDEMYIYTSSKTPRSLIQFPKVQQDAAPSPTDHMHAINHSVIVNLNDVVRSSYSPQEENLIPISTPH